LTLVKTYGIIIKIKAEGMMLTEVIVKRELMGCEISQKSKTEMLSATDLVKAGNKFRILNGLQIFDVNEYFRRKSTIEFIKSMEEKFGEIKVVSKGKNQHTWVHPFIFIDIALAINPAFKVEVYGWLFDKLLRYRNESGDSYKKMAGALFVNQSNKARFPEYISRVAERIKQACGVKDWNSAYEDQLKLRDKIHESIFLLTDVLKNNDKAVDYAIMKQMNEK
jgi:hypothetical protein